MVGITHYCITKAVYCLFTGVSGILNAEEESLTKLKSICTNQLSVGNLPSSLYDNLNRQKTLVDERLKLLQDQKLLFQVLCVMYSGVSVGYTL